MKRSLNLQIILPLKSKHFFNEFVVKTQISYQKIQKALEDNDILSFLPVKRFVSGYDDYYLVCVTEMNTKEDIDKFVEVLEGLQ